MPVYLYSSYTSYTFTLPYAGRVDVDDGDAYNVGSYGYYWSAGMDSELVAWILLFRSTGIYPQNYGRKGYGFSVRISICICICISTSLSSTLPYAGYVRYTDGNIYYIGSSGYDWSNGVYSVLSARSQGFHSTVYYPQPSDRKGNGFSVR